MERSEIRDSDSRISEAPDCAALHPGYGKRFYARTAANPNGGAAKPALEA